VCDFHVWETIIACRIALELAAGRIDSLGLTNLSALVLCAMVDLKTHAQICSRVSENRVEMWLCVFVCKPHRTHEIPSVCVSNN
jgi:hypothetical protein